MAFDTVVASGGTDSSQPWDAGAVGVSAVEFTLDATTDDMAASYSAKVISLPLGALILGAAAIPKTADASVLVSVGSTAGAADLIAAFTIATGNLDVVVPGAALAAPVVVSNTTTQGVWVSVTGAAFDTGKVKGKVFVAYPNLS